MMMTRINITEDIINNNKFIVKHIKIPYYIKRNCHFNCKYTC